MHVFGHEHKNIHTVLYFWRADGARGKHHFQNYRLFSTNVKSVLFQFEHLILNNYELFTLQ